MQVHFLWPPYVIGQAIIFSSCGFFFLLSIFFPHLFSDAGLKCAAHGLLKYRVQKIAKNSPSGHHRTTLSGCIFATNSCIDNQKKNLLNSNISTCPHNMVNFGPLRADISLPVWGTPAHFDGFRVLAAFLHGTIVGLVGVSQTLLR